MHDYGSLGAADDTFGGADDSFGALNTLAGNGRGFNGEAAAAALMSEPPLAAEAAAAGAVEARDAALGFTAAAPPPPPPAPALSELFDLVGAVMYVYHGPEDGGHRETVTYHEFSRRWFLFKDDDPPAPLASFEAYAPDEGRAVPHFLFYRRRS